MANHFILDAVAGAIICMLVWWGNRILRNLLPLKDCFLWCLRIQKPEMRGLNWLESDGADKDGQFTVVKGELE